MPDDVEIIFMDDGSDPPLFFPNHGVRNCNIYPTHDFRPWTQACARNAAADIAEGEFLLMTDIDHIISRDAIEAVRNFDGDKMTFPRYFAVLSYKGKLVFERQTLKVYGLDSRFDKRKILSAGNHTNTFAIRKSVYQMLGGYHPRYCGIASGRNHGDKYFYKTYTKCVKRGECRKTVKGPPIYVYPGMAKCRRIADIDPLGLFHGLQRG